MSRDTTVIAFRQPDNINDPLTELAREGARCRAPWKTAPSAPRGIAPSLAS